MAAMDEVPVLVERVRCGRREERFNGAADMSNFFRKPYGPGWALVGDAGCHKDPFSRLASATPFATWNGSSTRCTWVCRAIARSATRCTITSGGETKPHGGL